MFTKTDLFNKKQWMKEKNPFYMTDSLIKKLNEDKPKRAEIFNLPGKPKLEGRISDNEVSYWLNQMVFLLCGNYIFILMIIEILNPL